VIFKENIFHFEENISKVSLHSLVVWWERVGMGPAFPIKICQNDSSIRGEHVPNWNLTSSSFCFSEEGPSIVEGYASFGGFVYI
jgi:hypothetical protein